MQASIGTERGSRPRREPHIQSLDRGLVILESVARAGHPVGLAELAELFGIDRSSAFRLANTLRHRGFLTCPGDTKGYVLGPSMWRLAQQYDWKHALVRLALPFLRKLAGESGETAHLAIREGDHALFIDCVLGNNLITVSGQVGELVPIYSTAHGKALLADYSAEQLRALLGRKPLQAHTPRTITSLDQLAEVCTQTRARGFVLDDREYQDGMSCIAAPVRDRAGAVVGSIGISAPADRMGEPLRELRAEQVLKAAQAIHNQTQSR